MENLKLVIDELERALLTLNHTEAKRIIKEAIKTDSPIEITSELISKSLQRIGHSWEDGRLALSQIYMSSLICEEIIDEIIPPTNSCRIDQPRMAIAVFEDYHLLGKRIIYSTLRASGFDLMDLGGGLSAEKLIEIIHKENIKILLLSVLMLPTALRIKNLKDKLKDTDVKIIVGGAPFRFDQELWKEVGADACGNDSSDAIRIITKMTEEIL